MIPLPVEFDVAQGSTEWLELRRSKITATDAAVILGLNPWKNKNQLYKEKITGEAPVILNERMKRGTELEPIARDLFCIKTMKNMVPKVFVRDWAMASLDGINVENEILEIKCPGKKVNAMAINGIVPDYYYAQMQHQMYVCSSQLVYYFSFDGVDGIIIEISRNDDFIENMVEQEKKFYDSLANHMPV
jgi:putative phage-type endonuclease